MKNQQFPDYGVVDFLRYEKKNFRPFHTWTILKGICIYAAIIIDSNLILAGENLEDLPEIYVIFITENDVPGDNKPIYHIERCDVESGKRFGDGSHILYVNAKYKDDTPLGKLMHDFSCTNPSDMNYEMLAKRTRYFKEDKDGVMIMCKAMEDLIKEEKMEIAIKMYENGKVSAEELVEYFGVTVEEIERMKEHTV